MCLAILRWNAQCTGSMSKVNRCLGIDAARTWYHANGPFPCPERSVAMKPAAHALIPPLSIEHFLIQGLLGCLSGTLAAFFNPVFLIIVFPGVIDDGRFS